MKSRPVTEAQKFGSDIIWVAFSQILASLLGIIVLPAFTKSYTSEIYGVWAQASITMMLLTMILALGLGSSVQRFLAVEESREKRGQAFGAMLWTIIVFSSLVLLISVLLRQNLSIFLFDSPQYVSFVPLTFSWAFANVLFSFSISYLIARGKIKTLSIIQVAILLLNIAIMVPLATFGYSLELVIICLIVAQALFVALTFCMIIREIGFPKPDFGGVGPFLAFSLPLVPSALLFWIISSSDRYFIIHFVNLSQAGIYSASYSLANIIQLFYAPIGFILFPILSKFWDRGEIPRVKNYLEYSTKLFLVLAIPGSVGLYILSQPLLGILATSEYAVGGILVLLIALGIILRGIYLLNVYIVAVAKQTKWLPLMIAVAATTNVGINLILIPRIGIMGAAISTITSYFVLATIVTVWARRTVSYRIDVKFLAKVVLSTILMAFCLSFIDIGNALSISLATIAGAIVFGVGLFLLRAFSREDRRIMREVLSGLNPRLWR
jgi:O-antigen/teichoic acid export membrane protein